MDSYMLIVCGSHQERSAKIGETVSFFPTLVNCAGNGKVYDGTIRWELKRNAEQLISNGEIPSASYTGGITFRAEEAGYYKATFEAFRNGKSVAEKQIGVLVAPEQIRPTLPVPDDFSAFWNKQLEELRRIPVKAALTPLESSNQLAAFDLKAECAGNTPVSGIFMRPASVSPGKHPAILLPHGAGVRSAGYGRIAGWAAKGFLALDINAHGLENGHSPDWYQAKGRELAGYPNRGFDSGDPEKPYMRTMFLRVVRALELLAAMPEWDGRNLWIFGGSQGAWQSLAGAALMKKVSGIATWIPAGCDIYNGGWPFAELIGKAEKSPALRRTLPYYDGCSFCAQIDKIPVLFSVGLIDNVCKADGVMAAYNSLKTPHRELILHYQMAHETLESAMAELDRFIMTHLK